MRFTLSTSNWKRLHPNEGTIHMKQFTLRHAFHPSMQAALRLYLLDFRLFGTMHPLIQEVKLVSEIPSEPSVYDIKEETKLFGWLKMKPRYRVFVEQNADGNDIVYRSKIMGIMQLRIMLSMQEEANVLWLTEAVEVSNIPLLTKIFTDVFSPAHRETFARMRKHLEAKSS